MVKEDKVFIQHISIQHPSIKLKVLCRPVRIRQYIPSSWMKNNLGCFRDDDGIEVLTVEFAEFLIRPDRICSYAAIPYFLGFSMIWIMEFPFPAQHSTAHHSIKPGEVKSQESVDDNNASSTNFPAAISHAMNYHHDRDH